MLAGSVLSLLATVLRDRTAAGGWTYLLDAGGWLFAVAGAVAEARVNLILADVQADAVRRRATVLTIGGIVATLAGCVVLSTLATTGSASLARAAAAGFLVGGVGAGLGGILSLAVTSGARYAADRLANFDRD